MAYSLATPLFDSHPCLDLICEIEASATHAKRGEANGKRASQIVGRATAELEPVSLSSATVDEGLQSRNQVEHGLAEVVVVDAMQCFARPQPGKNGELFERKLVPFMRFERQGQGDGWTTRFDTHADVSRASASSHEPLSMKTNACEERVCT